MRTVQTAFKIPVYGDRHTIPNMENEVALLSEALKRERVQECVKDRTASAHIAPVRDLLEEGAKYVNTKGAFARFRAEISRAEFAEPEEGEIVNDDGLGDTEPEDGDNEMYEIFKEDLSVNDEEMSL